RGLMFARPRPSSMKKGETSMSKVGVLSKLRATPGNRPALIKALSVALEQVEAEDDTQLYILHEDAVDADAVWFYELHASQNALDAHMAAPWFKQLAREIGPLLAERPSLSTGAPIGGKGL